ncbi:RING-H2 finger protein [Musa troglodytarum]|uniref:RING-type E3 ubiquitin transferase n=1 Tax=Musa troglodytarum TaxID=320322 RepID=A0A9E7K6K9_9LILI|nr:RING-H2 finger protein [Musa troglodytarum]
MEWAFRPSAVLSPPLLPPAVDFENRINPSIFLIVVLLAVIFFVSGLLHLLARHLLRPINREPEDMSNVTALQGQLQQLFRLHDAGVDQSFIDTLPVFLYNAIIGVKDPFDCAVCLCEFEADDKLRLLPKCSHAFHLDCIDTWLLSHSACPLCRRSLIGNVSPTTGCSPIVLGLGSGISEASETEVAPVKLGKYRSVDVDGTVSEGDSAANSNLDQRRCFSMGSYEYVVDENRLLEVPIDPPRKPSIKKSECDCHSRREGFKGLLALRATEFRDDGGNSSMSSNLHVKQCFSVSTIWLRSKKEKSMADDDSSRRAFSFRLPLRQPTTDESKLKSHASPATTASEFNVSAWEKKSSSEVDFDEEIGSSKHGSVVSGAEEAPYFARRTLLWLAGRQNKVGNHI